MQPTRPFPPAPRPTLPPTLTALVALLTAALLMAAEGDVAGPELYVNGMRATGLRNAEMVHCTVKIDADGNLHVLSPGYRVAVDKDGKPLRIEGQSDFGGGSAARRAASLSQRYVLVYEPNAKVPFTFEITINGKPFRTIDLGTAAFTVDLTTLLKAGDNGIRVIGKPAGTPPPTSGENDVVKLRILRGEERSDGTFVAQMPPVWELVRSALDHSPIDRNGVLEVQ